MVRVHPKEFVSSDVGMNTVDAVVQGIVILDMYRDGKWPE